MNSFYRALLTLEACSWMLVVFVVKDQTTIGKLPALGLAAIIAIVSIALSLLSLYYSKKLGHESDIHGCEECELADGSFLPAYLGYFFVSVSVDSWELMLVVFAIACFFTHLSGTQLFNPLFLIFKYHHYRVKTKNGTAIFVIKKGPVNRNAKYFQANNLHRITDTTFIERK